MYQLPALISQSQILLISSMGSTGTHNRLVRTEDELLLQLSEFKDVFGFPALDVDLCEKPSDHFDRFWEITLVRTIIWRVFEDRFEQQWVSAQSRRRLGQVSVQLELPRLGFPLGFLAHQHKFLRLKTHVDKALKCRARSLLLLKLILAEQLMRSIRDERLEQWNAFEKQVADRLDHRLLLLPFRQTFSERQIDGEYVMDVPEDLSDEIFSFVCGDDVLC